jgi:hypothetical protein
VEFDDRRRDDLWKDSPAWAAASCRRTRDPLGAKRVLVVGLPMQALGALGYVFVRQLSGFYAWPRSSASSTPV